MVLGGLVMIATLMPGAMAAQPRPDVRYADGRLSVDLDGVPLDRVLEVVGLEAGLEFRGELRDWREVNKQFEAVPLPEALDRILGRQNFILRYGADGRPAVVELQGLAQPRDTRPAATPRRTNVRRVLTAAQPVPLSPVLRQALRADTAGPMQLLLAAVRQGSPDVRSEARRAFLRAVEKDRTLRDALVGADPKALVPLVRSLPAQRVDELLADLGTRSGDPVLRGVFRRTRVQLQQDRAKRGAASRG